MDQQMSSDARVRVATRAARIFVAAALLFAEGLAGLGCEAAAAEQDALQAADHRPQPGVDSRRPLDRAMVERIDARIADRWAEEGVEPASDSSDSEFIRRVYLDLVGVIPPVSAVREFLNNPASRDAKRSQLIDELLASPRHATHLANTWRRIMLPGGADLEQQRSVTGIQNWLRNQFASNLRYDRMVSDFLVATGGGESGPALYYTSLELKPEKLAASTSRIFLGLQIECAECHDHPFDHWKQSDFWGYAAFFAQLDQSQSMNGPQPDASLVDLRVGEVTLPDTDQVIPPRYPGGRTADTDQIGSRRVQLAIWMASRDNPYLARAAVNRVWAMLFGRGLVDPVDDLGEHNPASHPQLTEELTQHFISTGFDIRELIRVLAHTRAYQLSSATSQELPLDLFAAMAVKTLTPDQLYDCLTRVLSRANPLQVQNGLAAPFFDARRIAFTSRMMMEGANATEFNAGVLQALTLLNGSVTAALTNVETCGLLSALRAPWMDDRERIEILYLATVSRLPESAEFDLVQQRLAEIDSPEEREHLFADLLWALLNSAEFALNH